MDSETVSQIVRNLRDPINSKTRIHFTSRAVLFLIRLFDDKSIDIIDLHCILLKIGYASGCIRGENKHITLKNIVIYLYSYMPLMISSEDIKETVDIFNISNDSTHKEVLDMKIIVDSMI